MFETEDDKGSVRLCRIWSNVSEYGRNEGPRCHAHASCQWSERKVQMQWRRRSRSIGGRAEGPRQPNQSDLDPHSFSLAYLSRFPRLLPALRMVRGTYRA